ncbi:MAG: hypothetical protein EOM10_17125, partial [Opitutae bacterium]|nr:hypothetical protein [Opitutae bacterium]
MTGLTESTTYYFRIRADGVDGCVSEHSPTGSVTTKSSALDPPAAFSATAASASQIDLSFTKNGDDDAVVIVFDLDGTFEAPSGTPPAVGNSFAGGTLIYNGTGTGHSHTGLDACETYYYRAWSYDSTGPRWSTPLNDDEQTEGPDAPAGVWASVTNYTDFTAGWSAATGAESYRIDVSTSSNFTSGGGGAAIIEEGFDTLTDTTPPSGWTASKSSDLDYSILFGDSSPAFAFKNEGEWLRTPTFDAGATNVQFYTAGNGGSGSIISVSGLVSGAWTLMGAITNNTAGADYDIPVHSGATQLLFTFTYKSVNSSLDDVIVTGGGGGYVAGYEDRQVTGTESVSVTGLVEETAYYFRVRAEG